MINGTPSLGFPGATSATTDMARPNVPLALVLALPALLAGTAGGAFLGLHGDGVVPATFVGVAAHQLAAWWIIRSMSGDRQTAAASLFGRLRGGDGILRLPAATVAGVLAGHAALGWAFPSSFGVLAVSVAVALLLNGVLAAIALRSDSAVMLVRVVSVTILLAGVSLLRSHA